MASDAEFGQRAPNSSAHVPLSSGAGSSAAGRSRSEPSVAGSRAALQVNTEVEVERHRFPFCVVFTPLPMLTWCVPPIGHVGICTSEGVIHDFGGPYYVAEDNMTFGWPTRYWQLDPRDCEQLVPGAEKDSENGLLASYDTAVLASSSEYKKRVHNLCFDNCHSHVASALNRMRYNGRSDWTMFSVGIHLFLHGKFTNISGLLKTCGPLIVALLLIYTWYLH